LPEFGVSMMTKLSSRAAQGLGAGVMTCRIGLTTLDAVRPLRFNKLKKPTIKQVLKETFGLNASKPDSQSIMSEDILQNTGKEK